jgi:tryptophanyl-tRNA synthetase
MNNAIGLLDPPEAIWEKLRTAATCEHRQRRNDPGHPEHCNIFTMHQAFSQPDQISFADQGCRTAGIGCIECKKILYQNMMEEIGPVQERVKKLHESPATIMEALKSGAARCKSIAEEVIDEVRTKMGTKPVWMKS